MKKKKSFNKFDIRENSGTVAVINLVDILYESPYFCSVSLERAQLNLFAFFHEKKKRWT